MIKKYYIQLSDGSLKEVELDNYKLYNSNKFRIRHINELKLVYHYEHNKSRSIPIRIINVKKYENVKKLKLEIKKFFDFDIESLGIEFEYSEYDKEIIKLKNRLKRRK